MRYNFIIFFLCRKPSFEHHHDDSSISQVVFSFPFPHLASPAQPPRLQHPQIQVDTTMPSKRAQRVCRHSSPFQTCRTMLPMATRLLPAGTNVRGIYLPLKSAVLMPAAPAQMIVSGLPYGRDSGEGTRINPSVQAIRHPIITSANADATITHWDLARWHPAVAS